MQKTATSGQFGHFAIEPRRRANSEIKLLRLELIPRGKSPCEEIGFEWSPAQPTENLSPEKAAGALQVEVWASQSQVRQRYKKLQMRYPPEQFPDRHVEWRPSAELLGSPVARLNWFWQSGLIPLFSTSAAPEQNSLWNIESVEQLLEPSLVLGRLAHLFSLHPKV